MNYIASITSQGQLTVPLEIRKKLGLTSRGKVLLTLRDKEFCARPVPSVWSAMGALKSTVSLTDAELRKAREEYAKKGYRSSSK